MFFNKTAQESNITIFHKTKVNSGGYFPYLPTLQCGDKGYIERKTVEVKLTEIALNRSENHIGEITTDRGLQVRSFLLKTRSHF